MRIFSKIVGAPTGAQKVEDEKNDPPVVVNGPLSEIYTQALNQIYAVNDPVTGASLMGTKSTESQANDSHLARQIISELNSNSTEYTTNVPKTYIWASRLDLITPSSMDELVANVDEFENDNDATRYILVNDADADGGQRELAIGKYITNARTMASMEAYVLSKGGMVVTDRMQIFKK